MSNHQRKPQFPSRPENSRGPQRQFLSAPVTSAIGLEETAGRVRGRRGSLFTRTLIWVTGLICLAFLLGALAQAWSNSQLMQRMQDTQQQTQQLQRYHDQLEQLAQYYKEPFVIESEARQQLGYIRPGEHPVIIISSGDSGQQTTTHSVSQPSQQGFWQQWWDIFFGT